MSLLKELNTLLAPILPVETSVFSSAPPDEYLVLTPMSEAYALFGDNAPLIDVSEVRLSLFSKGSYTNLKRSIIGALLGSNITVTDRRYVGYEADTGYHHYAIDVAKSYEMEE